MCPPPPSSCPISCSLFKGKTLEAVVYTGCLPIHSSPQSNPVSPPSLYCKPLLSEHHLRELFLCLELTSWELLTRGPLSPGSRFPLTSSHPSPSLLLSAGCAHLLPLPSDKLKLGVPRALSWVTSSCPYSCTHSSQIHFSGQGFFPELQTHSSKMPTSCTHFSVSPNISNF